MKKLSDFPNIGPVVEKQLDAIGIHTYDDLCKAGAKEAWLRIQLRDPSAFIHRLLSLEGAIRSIRKNQLSEEIRDDLRQFYRAHCK